MPKRDEKVDPVEMPELLRREFREHTGVMALLRLQALGDSLSFSKDEIEQAGGYRALVQFRSDDSYQFFVEQKPCL